MHKGILLVTVIGAAPGCAAPVPESPEILTAQVRAELIAARDTVWRAWFAGDSALLVQILPDPMVGMGKPRDAIIADGISFRTNGGLLSSLAFSNDEFVVRNDMALLLSSYQVITVTAGVADTMRGQATEVFTMENGRWVNPYWHLHEE